MAPPAALDLVRRAEVAVREAASVVQDPDAITPLEAVELFEAYERVIRVAGAVKLLLAKRVDASGEARRRGFPTSADLLAHLSGTSIGAAKSDLATSEALSDLPDTSAALLGGLVSTEQGKIVAGAAKVNPGAERHLLKKAKTSNQRELRDEAQKAKVAADLDADTTHRRIHKETAGVVLHRWRGRLEPAGSWHRAGWVRDHVGARAADR